MQVKTQITKPCNDYLMLAQLQNSVKVNSLSLSSSASLTSSIFAQSFRVATEGIIYFIRFFTCIFFIHMVLVYT